VDGEGLHFALRELHAGLRPWRQWAAVLLAGAVAGLTGPFGTFDVPPLPRMVYWLMVAAGSYGLGVAVGTFVAALLRGRAMGLLAWVAVGALPGLPIAGLVTVLNRLTFGWTADSGGEFLVLVGYCAAISVAVSLGVRIAQGAPGPGASPTPADGSPAAPRLLSRLPPEKQGRLLHLRMADHYVEVTTDQGTELLLLRFSDAIAETVGVPGLQVHRSHWVALEAVRKAGREGGRPVLELETGAVVPISRTFLGAAREAGLA
jgi:hypothetical protein